ncbi:PH domain-containing protein [Mycena indigotica]|uniref:PH domain-containing protein n=1 Tax=Mycena indigotica TaxID=2126181 RepID=A0A8H6TCZ9_9AGAR|nr:PH domain-containing protein [Mycena indigotica]KAF7315210.1 PH domain-containing protein [Mycena indigotica]
MASAPSPLRDRLLSNSPDPVKNHILRESGHGWTEGSPKGSPNISPLRIAKRESPVRRPPPSVARRNSSSFKHVKNNNLVSKSPFKSQIPKSQTPTSATSFLMSPTRRVSGEKRPRPQSMHDQAEAENDRPFAFKRERRQSRTYQGLMQKEPVTKSPFRQDSQPPPAPIPPVPPTPSRIPVMATTSASPVRSSLVSKRMHGPRGSNTSRERREERKVTFNEACDVVEFDLESEEEEELVSEEGNSADIDPDSTPEDPFIQQSPPPQESSYDSVDLSDASMLPDTSMPLELDPDVSITGIVDAMFFAPADGTSTPPPHLGSSHTRTYEFTPDHPTDLDTEEGIPFGRSHHAERSAAFHAHQAHPAPIPQPQLSASRPLPRPDMARSRSATPPHSVEDHATPPLGRTTHFERRHTAAAEDHYSEDENEARDVARLPGSPSPAPGRVSDFVEIGVSRFSLPSGGGSGTGSDPFSLPQLRDESLPHDGDDSRDLSLRRSESDRLLSEKFEQGSPRPAGMDSPSGGRPRISREDVQRRMRARSATPELEEPRLAERMDVVDEEENTSHDQSSEMQDNSVMADDDDDEFKEEREAEARWELAQQEEREGSASTEIAVIETAERRIVNPQSPRNEEPVLSPSLGLDFGTQFGMDMLSLPAISGSVNSRLSGTSSMRTAERLEPERMSVDMDTRSALDRLMEDVAGAGGFEEGDESVRTDEVETPTSPTNPHAITRAATDSALLQIGDGLAAGTGLSRTVSVASSSSLLSLPPPVPPKDNIHSRETREAMILEARRERRRMEEGDDYRPQSTGHLRAGRPSARRSMSTGDVQDLVQMRNDGLLDIGKDDLLGATIQKELNKRDEPQKRKYHVREREGLIYASSSDPDGISHLAGAGDLDVGKAWRTVRRPSDMNEYSKQIKEYRAQQNPGKAFGKVFVKVVGVRGIHLPLPTETTALTCTLNNGIHFVTTPEFPLGADCPIDQEFELIEHSKLEFTMTIKVRKDPHIAKQFKSLTPTPTPVAPIPPPMVQPAPSKPAKRSFWSSSPKKSKDKAPPPQPQPVPTPVVTQGPLRLPENLARYLKPDGTLARSFIAFKDIAQRCDTRLFESSYPLIGQRLELGGKSSTLQVGELVLQILRLPPLSGIPPDQLPQSLDESLRGLRHINWHKVTYFQGTLTQNGGDCSTWRRRQFRVVGASLISFNDVTKKATATIDLKKAVAVEDDQEARGAMSPASNMTGRSSRYDEYDGLYGVERSFRLIFPNNQEISFFADTDEEKSKWLEILRALVGHIPPHPLWAELLWQRQEELSRRPVSGAPQPES